MMMPLMSLLRSRGRAAGATTPHTRRRGGGRAGGGGGTQPHHSGEGGESQNRRFEGVPTVGRGGLGEGEAGAAEPGSYRLSARRPKSCAAPVECS